MRKLFIIPIFLISLVSSAATYYVSPTGIDNTGNGSIENPWFSLTRAWSVIASGDIIYMRGGIYSFTNTQNLSGKNGSAGNLIKIWAYPGEIPIITKAGSFSYSSWTNPLILMEANYVHWKGLTITGNVQTNTEMKLACELRDCNYCIFEQIVVNNNSTGMWLHTDNGTATGNHFNNCDFYDNRDPYTNYGNGDGFGFNVAAGNTNYLYGIRCWNNSDDGFDPYGSDGVTYIDRSWFFWNGLEYKTNKYLCDASGIKFGSTLSDHGNQVLYYVTNCISYRNSWIGFNQNGAMAAIQAYNNITAYNGIDNGRGQGWQLKDVDGIAHILKNNISFNDNNNAISSAATLSANTFLISGNNPSFTVTSADFINTNNPEQLLLPRKADGNLPDIDFLHLASGSDLINRGIDVGLAYSGNSPDLGPFETQLSTASAIPSYLSSSVENATPTLLEISYNITLANIVPAVSAFSVIVNSVPRTVNSVTISGSKVQLTLASAIKYGDIITVTYIKPSSNPLKSESGGEAISFSAKPTTNNLTNVVKDTAPATISMIISPNPVHKIINIAFQYTSTAVAPQIIRIVDISGKLFIEKLLNAGVPTVRFSINLNSGVYSVLLFSGGLQIASQKIIVHK